MRRIANVLTAAAVAAGVLVVGPSAGADHCSGNIYVFSRVRVENSDAGVSQTHPTLTSEAIGCTALTEAEGVDSRWIYPGANEITVRYLEDSDFGDLVTVSATLNGLGLDNTTVVLTREPGIGGLGFNYDSARLAIDPTAQGYLDVQVIGVVNETGQVVIDESDQYRTVDQPTNEPGHLPF